MNVDKELIALDHEQECIKAKYGRRFKKAYDKAIHCIVHTDRALEALTEKRKTTVNQADELMGALAITETEV